MKLNLVKHWICLVTFLVSPSVDFAQVNFFECAKDPTKCRQFSNESAKDGNLGNDRLDRSQIEVELKKKLQQEFDTKQVEDQKKREEIEQLNKIKLEAEIRLKLENEIATQQVLEQKKREQIEAENRARVEEELKTKYESILNQKLNPDSKKDLKVDYSIRIPLQPNRKALVMGNDNYLFVNKLQNARADANAIGKNLSNLGYKVVLKNDLNEKDMKSVLRQFKEEINSDDEIIIFYAGHGVQLGTANFLLPVDIRAESADQVKDDAIQLQRLLDDMTEKKAKFTLALIDACRDNPFPKTGRAIGGSGLAVPNAATGQMIIFSAGSGQQAMDRLGTQDKDPNGLFTRILLKEMYSPGIRIDNVVREVRKKVVEAAKSVGHDQTPAIYDEAVGDFYFIPPK